MTEWQQHFEKWKDCRLCSLCDTRRRIVLARGKIPADILFIGEAPGPSEDMLGKPFIGPAGKLMDDIIGRSIEGRFSYCMTNLVACIPLESAGKKFAEPPVESIKACAQRLQEFVKIVRPRLIVRVGVLAKKHVYGQSDFSEFQNMDDPKFASLPWIPRGKFLLFADLIHPAAILRMNRAQQGLAVQRCVVELLSAVREL